METRKLILERLKTDLIGPSDGPSERIPDSPSDRYLLGILYPQNTEISSIEDEQIEELEAGKVADQDTSSNQSVSIFQTTRPSAMGISFSVKSETKTVPSVKISVSAGIYRREEGKDDASTTAEPETSSASWGNNTDSDKTNRPKNGSVKSKYSWKRTEIGAEIDLALSKPAQNIEMGKYGCPGLRLFVRCQKISGLIMATVQLINLYKNNDLTGNEITELSFFQAGFEITTQASSKFAARPIRTVANDEDSRSAKLIFRKAIDYATGHTCAAEWSDKAGTKAPSSLSTSWVPKVKVLSVDPNGDPSFMELMKSEGYYYLDANFLANADSTTLFKTLSFIPRAYSEWLVGQEKIVQDLPSESLRKQASNHILRCRKAIERMNDGIKLLETDPMAREAFQKSNEAMQIQAAWSRGNATGEARIEEELLKWRPFQLGFSLMCLCSLADPQHEDRDLLDLIWFPTGGGKTEAYLLVAAFILFFRRISVSKSNSGYGTGVLMRYTLRTLTVQQFQRAASLICACEAIRRGRRKDSTSLGERAFSIGLWVGMHTTPNKVEDAIKSIHAQSESTPKQIRLCPACGHDLEWKASADQSRVDPFCTNTKCLLGSDTRPLPIMTVDELIYQQPPSLLIGTIDKFAQIVRRDEVAALFGHGEEQSPPDLIIQDELHLISGPLGTLAGIYETAIDSLCMKNGVGPKIIGSTATIRRATEQVKALFNRRAFQFPPPVIDEENSGFACRDDQSPGRIYVGITTAGRSDKYVLQAVCASLLQALMDTTIPASSKDPYGTLVTYFNSLRVLGGALVAFQDDVVKSISAIAGRRGEDSRSLSEPEEMTSRKDSSEIPKILEQLKIPYGERGSIDALLASNMLSVGVDIPRLGLMVVNGQPKTMSEYIQATSRVGRQAVPGLVVTIYNNSKTRDRSHYENFLTWHKSLYRDIEATSVTPFAPRARDKALHACVVALTRHMITDMASPNLTDDIRDQIEKKIVPVILDRVLCVDQQERIATEKQLQRLLDDWQDRGHLKYYWNDYRLKQSLLISGERAAAQKTVGHYNFAAWETPNSMRNVEAGVDFKLWESAELNRKNDGK